MKRPLSLSVLLLLVTVATAVACSSSEPRSSATTTDLPCAVTEVLAKSCTTFCRGIGPVSWHYVDGAGNGYDATLTAHTM